MRLAIIVAMQKEYDLLLQILTVKKIVNGKYVECLTHSGKTVAVAMSGIGKVNAAMTACTLISEYMATHIISTGCAGGADISVEVGDIIVGNSFCYYDVYCGEPNMNGQVQGMPSAFPSCYGLWLDVLSKIPTLKIGAMATGDWFVTTTEKINAIRNYLPACFNIVAVDMESAAIAQVCYKKEVGFTAIRVISDNPVLPEQTRQYEGFWDDLAKLSFSTINKILNSL